MNIPYYFNNIQPRYTQVWNCDYIFLDPNGKWHKVICTYRFLPGERMWKVQKGERAPFCCTWLVFIQANGKCFMPPIIFHQEKDNYQDPHLNIALNWILQHTPCEYMDRYGCIKATAQLSTAWGASTIKNKIIFFDGNDSHFDDRALSYMGDQNIQPFSWR